MTEGDEHTRDGSFVDGLIFPVTRRYRRVTIRGGPIPKPGDRVTVEGRCYDVDYVISIHAAGTPIYMVMVEVGDDDSPSPV